MIPSLLLFDWFGAPVAEVAAFVQSQGEAEDVREKRELEFLRYEVVVSGKTEKTFSCADCRTSGCDCMLDAKALMRAIEGKVEVIGVRRNGERVVLVTRAMKKTVEKRRAA